VNGKKEKEKKSKKTNERKEDKRLSCHVTDLPENTVNVRQTTASL